MLKYDGDKQAVCYVGDSLNDCEATTAGIVLFYLTVITNIQMLHIKIHSLEELLE